MPMDDWGYGGPSKEESLLNYHKFTNFTRKAIEVANLKYPLSVGEDFNTTINYNSHEASDYAMKRVNDQREGFGIKEDAYEPFMFFEFLEVMSDEHYDQWKIHNKGGTKKAVTSASFPPSMSSLNTPLNQKFDTEGAEEGNALSGIANVYYEANPEMLSNLVETSAFIEEKAQDTSWFDKAKRVYNGSIALYMPTDIAINDTVVYNEQSRTIMGTIEGITSPKESADKLNMTVATSTGVLGGIGGLGGWISETVGKSEWAKKFPKTFAKFGKFSKGFGVIGGAGLAQVIGPETQRHTGRLMNPHEYMAYQTTGMRSFTFTWTFLPDNADESKQAAKIIKHFRRAQHATRDDYLRITVPDQVIISFHGALDMIQMPPVVIESVAVTYNPNNASYFKHPEYGNSPVEVGLAVTFKEIVPLYRDDVEAGF